MMIPAVALKILGGAVAVGAVASSIAVPTALSMNTAKEIVLKNFPSGEKDKFKDKCQLLTKDEDSSRREVDKWFLLVCDDNSGSSGATFYYYSSGETPEKISELVKKDTVRRGNRTTAVAKLRETEADLTSTNGDWTNLIGKSLSNCVLTKNDDGEKRWSVKCPKGDTGDKKDIPLTPVIIN